MKGLSLFDKLIFFFNSLAAAALLLSYLLPFIPPKTFPLLSVLSLGVPLLIVLNFFFLLYWVIRLKRQILLSLIVLLIGFNYVSSFYKFSGSKEENSKDSSLISIMSYNVRMFNEYRWTKEKEIPEKITDFVLEHNPDILCVQEHFVGASQLTEVYPYSYIKLKGKNAEFGSAIFSKYPILTKNSLDFPHDGNNNAIYTDVVVGTDTIRIFNVHFQSLNIKPKIDDLQKENSKKLLGRIGYGFSLQQEQMEMMMEPVRNSPYKVIIAGDFNNTSFSYIYNEIKAEERFTDAFLEAGSGFGKSFKLNYFPLRIDFMFMDEGIKINSYKKFKIHYSDHYPILSTFRL